MNIFVIIFCAVSFSFVSSQFLDYKEVQCLICGILVEEIKKEVAKVDPNKKVSVGSFRVDHKGDNVFTEMEFRRSDVFLTDLLDTICSTLDNYARAYYKSNGRLVIFPLISESGGMHPLMSKVDIIQDGDLNKSLKFHCDGILDEFDDTFMKSLKKGIIDEKALCSKISEDCLDILEEKVELEAAELAKQTMEREEL